MHTLRPRDCGLSEQDVKIAYLPRVTLAREDRASEDADLTARRVLSTLAGPRDATGRARGVGGKIGICVVGPRGSGKSRLIWELHQQDTLADWTLVVWPRSPQAPYRFGAIEKRRFVILLDQLEEYADAADELASRWLDGAPRDFATAGVALIVIATCRQMTDAVTESLGALCASLETIELGPISEREAQALADNLTNLDRTPYPIDEPPLWPGSIVHGREDDQRRANSSQTEIPLSEDAMLALKILKLFASAGIGSGGDPPYLTKERVCAVADALFDTPRLRWREATDSLLSQRKVQWAETSERAIFASSDEVLKDVVDYPLYGNNLLMEVEDWPGLFQVFKATSDAEAMVALGQAWSNSPLPRQSFPNPPTKMEYLMQAAECFRTALDVQYRRDKERDPFSWARTEWLLANALANQNTWMVSTAQGPSRLEVLQEAATAYQEALKHFGEDLDPDSWISLTTSLAYIFSEQAKQMTPDAAAAQLQEAVRFATAATEALSSQTAPEVAASAWITQADTQVNCARRATESNAAAEWEDKAAASARKALSQPAALSKASRGMALGTLGLVTRIQASLKTGEERATLLSEAVKKLREALDTVADDSEQSAETRSWVQTTLVDTLLQHARTVGPTPQARVELDEAQQQCEQLLPTNTPLDPDSLAGLQGAYAGVLAQQVHAEFAEESERVTLLQKALDYCSAAYDMRNRESHPDGWADTCYSFAEVALEFARLQADTDRDSACKNLDAASQLVTEALEVFNASAPAFFGERRQALDLAESIKQCETDWGCSG
jgi:hypothetical protein